MSHEPNSDRDELRLSAMLRAVDAGVAPPDRRMLEALRQRSLEVFAPNVPPDVAPVSDSFVESLSRSIPGTLATASRDDSIRLINRRNPMLTIAARGVVAASMMILVLATWFVSNGPTPLRAGTVPFSKILDELRGASTLEFSLLKSGAESRILVRAPGLVRKEESATRYEIAAGSRLWKVDEVTNSIEERDSPWFLGPASQVDLLGLLELGVTDASAFLRAKPVGRAPFPSAEKSDDSLVADSDVDSRKSFTPNDQANCFVYRVELPTEHGRVQVEAFVNQLDQKLVGIVAWPAGEKRNAGPPLAELRLIAMNNNVGDDKFEISNSLTEDGRIGNVSHSQGIVVLRPMLAKRWSPIGSQTLLKPGDWLRTELRGANAAKVILTSDVQLTLGPGTLVECISPTKARVHHGMVQVSMEERAAPVDKTIRRQGDPTNPAHLAAKGSTEFMLLAPRDGSRVFKWGDKRLVRVDREEHFVDVPQIPVWLAGFEGTTNNESLGSLIVNLPDGRNEPLTVGYHKVSVEIHDQIARTTIEESFVNRTTARLEGVFHFPLPQDASISGFGMWIGNDLVEADVVEKQRAREIYETILRERRDPGLLEWTGGNLFKARVFPIEPHSEKRIKIVYTQVLPLRGNRYRYAYGLRSDLLRTSPLRELSLTVTVNSALALKSVTCPTHAVRTQQTGHSAQVEFSAQEYTPTRDFEVVCEVDQQQSDVVIVPHRRGDEGYFLVQITPPFQRHSAEKAAGGARLNELIPDGNPLNFILLCDTSGSMDSDKRAKQSEFVATVLSSLAPDDRFQIAACDVGTVWSGDVPMSPSDENIATSTKFLNERLSLGWTNLDRAFDEVLKKAAPGSQIIYIGDGIVSSGDTDPSAFVKRLGQRFGNPDEANKAPTGKGNPLPIPMTFHSITVGNTYESVVLKGIASIGRGSVRTISGEQSPQVVARELLNEIAEPGLRDINVEFRGLKVAAVYPGRLPNVASGTQQILVGRYLPEEGQGDQHGEVIVTGLRGSEKVKFAARISLKNAEEGNSFIPRLWGRAHLDHLLTQGQSGEIQAEIIRLSEEFHIITPFTSLLVLETDADRERFGVQRRYEMRDGERFFTAGRDNANYDLLHQQMKRAGDWRIGLRRQVLQSLSKLGRNPQILQDRSHRLRGMDRNGAFRVSDRTAGVIASPFPINGPMSGGIGGGDGFDEYRVELAKGLNDYFDGFQDLSFLGDRKFPIDSVESKSEMNFGRLISDDRGLENGRGPMPAGGMDLDEPIAFGLKVGLSAFKREKLPDSLENAPDTSRGSFLAGEFDESPPEYPQSARSLRSSKHGYINSLADFEGINVSGLAVAAGRKAYTRFGRSGLEYGHSQPDYTSWVNTLFPPLDPPPAKSTPIIKDPELWSLEAIALAKSLLRTESLLKLDGGIELSRQVEFLDPRSNRSAGGSRDLVLYSPSGWLTRGQNPANQTLVSYCDAMERGIYSLAFLSGRTRASVTAELKSPPLGLTDFSVSSLLQSYFGDAASVDAEVNDRVTLSFTSKGSPSVDNWIIDTKRHVIVHRMTLTEGRLMNSESYEDFVEIAGTWWATKIVVMDGMGRPTSETRLQIAALTKEQYAERMNAELAAKPSVQFVHLPVAPLRIARQKVADGFASFEDRLMLILHNAQRQQWDEMWKHVEAVEKLAADKPGIRWMRTILLATIRRNEEAMHRLTDESARLVPAAAQDEVFLAEFILGQANSLASVPEIYKLQQLLKPVYDRPFAQRLPVFQNRQAGQEQSEARARAEIQRQIKQTWNDREMSSLEVMGHPEEALPLRRAAAETMSWDHYRQETYAQRLASAGRIADAHAWLRQALARPERNVTEEESLRTAVAELYRQQGQWDDLLKWTTDWIARNPESTSSTSAYSQHLAALIFNDQLDAAYALADQWLKDARVEGKLTALQRARLETALNFANGNLYQINLQRMDERWFEPLAATARFFVRNPHHFDLVQRCVSNYYFTQSDISDQLRGEWLRMLQSELEKLNATQIGALVSWTLSGRMEIIVPNDLRRQMDGSEVSDEIWQSIAKAVKVRWLASQNKEERVTLSETLRAIYTNRFAKHELLPFLRERIPSAPSNYKLQFVAALFDTLLTTTWSDDIEQEAFTTWRDLTDKTEPSERLAVELPALMRLVDAMLANRSAVGERQLNDQGDSDKMTRKDLALKKAEMRKAARLGLSARLAVEASKEDRPANVQQKPDVVRTFSIAAWLKMEQFWLDIKDEQNLAKVEEECWTILGNAPPRPVVDDDVDAPQDDSVEAAIKAVIQAQQAFFDALLRQRAFATVTYLATRKQAVPASATRLLKYVDAGIAGEADGAKNEERSDVDDSRMFWRKAKFRVLVALDRPDDLEKELREWIRTEVSTGPWRQFLARLVAERGMLDEAIQLFEACERDKLLSAADYRLLADWYLAVNRRDAYDRSRIEAYVQMPEGNLGQMIYQTQNRWQQTNIPLPSELDENTLFVFKALFKKSAQPENYLWQLRNLYAATRDFRLLQMLPDAVLGRSPQQAYAFIQSLQSHVLYELRNEATADEILTQVEGLRAGNRTATDLRALDLLESFIERKSSEILNQPGPHIDACLAALQRAFQREWSEGEPKMMSQFLLNFDAFPHEKLQSEQLREMRALRLLAPVASRDHLAMTSNLCQLLCWNYTRHNEALREFEAEVQAYLQANDGIWPHADNDTLGRYVQMLEGANQHAAGETVLKKHIARPANDEQRKWLNDRLMSLYNHALEHDGAVSIGTGRAKLFSPIVDLTLLELETAPDENVRYNLVVRLNTTFDIAYRHTLPATIDTVRRFTFETLPNVLRRQTSQYRNTATAVMQSVGTILGPKQSLQYVVERMEQWPQRLEIQYDNSWNAFGNELAARREAAGTTDLDARVLKLAIARLQRDLRQGEVGNHAIYHIGYQHFWREKTPDFAKAAEDILNERRASGRRAMVVANYLRHGLQLFSRANEILLIAYGKGLLEEAAQYQLVTWLHQENRYAEMIPILDPLVSGRPDNINYRTELMVAYFHSQRPEQLRELIEATHKHFHQAGRWTEGNIAQFARGCQGAQQWDRMQAYFTEVIALHQWSSPASGVNDNVLSDYYQELARAESNLNHTEAAVTAASAAIVCWDARHQQRQYTLNTLREVLNAAKDLAAYVEYLDAEATKSGQDSPILRKAIGDTYRNRNDHVHAITQYQLAVELQPNDKEIHQALIACYDAVNNSAAATAQLLKLIDLQRHDLSLFQQLAGRLKDNEAEAERAATSIIESAPNEAESHAAMAELRQKQDRWSEAIPHWEQVAKLRKLEPTGLLKLAEAQLHEKQWDGAKESINQLSKTEWPSRFNNVVNEIQQFQQRLPKN